MQKNTNSIYLDNSATSWPKPNVVTNSMVNFMQKIGANPGRSGHINSINAARLIYDARENIAKLFNSSDPMKVVFGLNATDALNLAIKGTFKKNDHIITSSLEHNSVMRPLRELEKSEVITLTVLDGDINGIISEFEIEKNIKPNTRAIVINHASNVTGTIQNLNIISKIAKNNNLIFIVDASQTAGSLNIDLQKADIDLLAFTGHKYLLGPQGTGGLVIGENFNITNLDIIRSGGTGSRSEDEIQPDFLPDKYEAGTPNTVGITGLNSGIEFILKTGIEKIRAHEINLTTLMLDGLKNIPNIKIYGTQNPNLQTATISITITGKDPGVIGFRLDDEYNIMTRVGMHCSPAAHKKIGTYPIGTIRLSMGYFNTKDDIIKTLIALKNLSEEA